MEIARTICKEKLDSKTRAPPWLECVGSVTFMLAGLLPLLLFCSVVFLRVPKPWAWRAEVFLDAV